MSDQDKVSLEIAGRKIPIIRHEHKDSGDYVFFPITRDGLHYSVHPTGNPHLRNNTGQLAELNLEALKQITQEDFMSLFKYPKYDQDVLVFPIPSSIGVWLGESRDILQMFSGLFQSKVLYVMRAGRLPEFFQVKPGNYMIFDLKGGDNIMMQFQGSPYPPLNFNMNTGPRNPQLRNMFSINMGIMKALDKIPDSALKDFQPDEFTISQWGVQIKATVDQVQVVRWTKGGRERLVGRMIDYFRARR